jgi:uncharacterized OsmC-like protein
LRVAVKAKTFAYSVTLDRAGRHAAEVGAPVEFGAEWSAEHLVLAGLAQCITTSLRHFARQRGAGVVAAATASGTVTRRDDGRYGFVEIDCALDVEIDPEPDALEELLDRAEWGCFIGASLVPKPTYRWRVNGRDVR